MRPAGHLGRGRTAVPHRAALRRDLDSVLLVKHGRGSPVERVKITVACDVTNPLFGPAGAAFVYGPQKGATPGQVLQLDHSLQRLAERLGKLTQAATPGAGAAGGLGFGMLAFFNATLRSGVEIVLEAVNLRGRLAGADLCITGEGRLDASSLHGKAPLGVARLCRSMNVPCIALAGSVADGAEKLLSEGLTTFFPLHDGSVPHEQSMREAPALLKKAAGEAVRRTMPGG